MPKKNTTIAKEIKNKSLLNLVGVINYAEVNNLRKHITERRALSRKRLKNLGKRLCNIKEPTSTKK